jgi:hypothetical protein
MGLNLPAPNDSLAWSYKRTKSPSVGNTRASERGGGGESVVYKLKQFYAF